jgi:histidyl-tRNA synthetase
MSYCMPLLDELRKNQVSSEMYPESVKMKKQMQYADKNSIPFVLVAGQGEMDQKIFQLKDMKTGEQFSLTAEQVIQKMLNYKTDIQ